MQKHISLKMVSILLLAALMGMCFFGCAESTLPGPANPENPNTTTPTPRATPDSNPDPAPNTDPITVVWYPNESSNTHDDVRAEVGKIIEQATGRPVTHTPTTDYTIAIEAIASGSADIAMAMGAVGYIEAKNRNPEVNVMFVNSDKNGSLDEAKYFSWLCVDMANAEEYKSGDTYAIDNIKGKSMSFVSNSSTSGFRVPTSSIIEYFAADALDEDALVEGGSDKFFSEVYFGGSHQGSAVNLVTGTAQVAAFCDIELQPYIELKSGEANTVGAVYAVREGADAPFDQYAGKEFVVIASTPVFNGPNAYNPMHLSEEEIKAITDLFTSEEVAGNEILFYDDSIEGNTGLYKKSASYGYVKTTDDWYDPYR